MSLDLDIEGLTAEQKAAIKTKHNQAVAEAVQKRIKLTKEQEETATKLERLDALEAAEAQRLKDVEATKLVADTDKFAGDNGIKDLAGLKELKAYDKIAAEKDEEKRKALIADLKKSKPALFVTKKVTQEGRNLLGLSGVDLKNKTANAVKVY